MMSILRLPAGNARMQEIAAAIQAGAKAYLNRQYTTIAHRRRGAVRAHRLLAHRLAHGGRLRGRRHPLRPHRLHRHEHLGARERAHGAKRRRNGLNAALKVAFRGGAITGMLVVGLGLLGVAGYFMVLRGPHR